LTGGPNACAAVASQYYLALGVITKAYLLTSTLITALLNTGRFTKVSLADLQPGDLVVTLDDPADKDKYPEHVWHYYGPSYPAKTNQNVCQPGWGWAVDNYQNSPYPRNITAPRPKTQADYGLRLIN
jgi:hypothetical protein